MGEVSDVSLHVFFSIVILNEVVLPYITISLLILKGHGDILVLHIVLRLE